MITGLLRLIITTTRLIKVTVTGFIRATRDTRFIIMITRLIKVTRETVRV